jgi:hypothetical protein
MSRPRVGSQQMAGSSRRRGRDFIAAIEKPSWPLP